MHQAVDAFFDLDERAEVRDVAYRTGNAVADAVLHALFSKDPKERYLAVTDRHHAAGMIRNVLNNLAELSSNGHPFNFSRDELVKMLDEALPRPEDD